MTYAAILIGLEYLYHGKEQSSYRFVPVVLGGYWKFLRKVTRSFSFESDPPFLSKVTRLS